MKAGSGVLLVNNSGTNVAIAVSARMDFFFISDGRTLKSVLCPVQKISPDVKPRPLYCAAESRLPTLPNRTVACL